MAWFVTTEYRDPDQGTYWTPEIEKIPIEHERFNDIAKAVGMDIEAKWIAAGRDRDSASYPLIYNESFAASLNQGWRFPTVAEPYCDRLKQEITEPLVDIVDTSFGGYAISQKVIDMIESIEPSIHQYLPYELVNPDGSMLSEKRWLLNICARVEAVDTERSNIAWAPDNLPRTFGDITAGDKQPHIIIKADEASKRALWWEWRYLTARGFMVSDRLWDRLQSEGVRGWSTKFTNREHMEEL